MAFSISALASSGCLAARQIVVRPGVRADGVAGRRDLTENFRIVGGVLADREEDRLDAFGGERLEHRRRGRPRAVVEGQHDLVVAQEVELLEMLEAEARAAGGVDLDRAGDAERIRIVALGRRTSRRRQERAARRGAEQAGARAGACWMPGAGARAGARRHQRRRRAGGRLLSGSRSEDQQGRRKRQSKRCRTTHYNLRTHEN